MKIRILPNPTIETPLWYEEWIKRIEANQAERAELWDKALKVMKEDKQG